MFCNQCGAKNYDDARYCSSCGNILVQPQHSTQIPPTKSKVPSLWNPNAAANWSLLFTPVFGSYLQMKNWEALGNNDETSNARNWLIFSIVFILFINFGTPFIWSDPIKLSTYPKSLGFLYIIVWYFSFARIQPKYVKDKLKDRYQKKSWTVPLLSAIVIFFVSAIIILAVSDVIVKKTQFQQNDDKRFDPSSAVLYKQEGNPFAKYVQPDPQPTAPNKTQKPWEMDWDNGTIIPPKQELTNTTQSELEKAHIDTILKAHPDAGAIVESQDFKNWVSNQSNEWNNYYKDVIDKGTSTQVIEMLDNYKRGINH
ncbi:zinc ribbon domain-containing protein [Acinetobacter ursingii]|uniref:zinc ribbon domain-containing protein n=1 Tax=Acinetobacter ursingii TaxID=108980 RepID=UPI003AF7B1F0